MTVCSAVIECLLSFFFGSSRLATEATLMDGWMDVRVAQGHPYLDSEAKAASALVIFTLVTCCCCMESNANKTTFFLLHNVSLHERRGVL